MVALGGRRPTKMRHEDRRTPPMYGCQVKPGYRSTTFAPMFVTERWMPGTSSRFLMCGVL